MIPSRHYSLRAVKSGVKCLKKLKLTFMLAEPEIVYHALVKCAHTLCIGAFVECEQKISG